MNFVFRDHDRWHYHNTNEKREWVAMVEYGSQMMIRWAIMAGLVIGAGTATLWASLWVLIKDAMLATMWSSIFLFVSILCCKFMFGV